MIERENYLEKVTYTGKILLGRKISSPYFRCQYQCQFEPKANNLCPFSIDSPILKFTMSPKNYLCMMVTDHSFLFSLKTCFHPCHKKTCLSIREMLKSVNSIYLQTKFTN